MMAPQPTVPSVAMFLEPSTTTALLAVTVPSVIPSSFSRSTSFKSAEPIIKLVPAVIDPLAAIALPKLEAPTICNCPEPEIAANCETPVAVTVPYKLVACIAPETAKSPEDEIEPTDLISVELESCPFSIANRAVLSVLKVILSCAQSI